VASGDGRGVRKGVTDSPAERTAKVVQGLGESNGTKSERKDTWGKKRFKYEY